MKQSVLVLASVALAVLLAATGVVWAEPLAAEDQEGSGQSAASVTEASQPAGRVWSWGFNRDGQLGDGTTANRSTPVRVEGLSGVVDVSSGRQHSLALKTDGTVWAWGGNDAGQLGDGTTANRITPIRVIGLINVVDVSAGGGGGGIGLYNHSLAVKDDGTVWAWGRTLGEFGDVVNSSKTPTKVSGLNNVADVEAGWHHSLALKDNGVVRAWGYNGGGQLRVDGLRAVKDVSGGGGHSLAAMRDRTVQASGPRSFGQLGVRSLRFVVDVEAGFHHSLAVRSNGTVWGSGENHFGELGDGTTTERQQPVRASGLNTVVDLSSSYNHSLAVAAPPEQ